ncbi:darobactin export ABC transporter permease subunit [Yersinia enterocolitica]
MLTSEFFNDLKLSPVSSLLAILITAIGLISLFFVLLLYLTDSRIEKHNSNYKDIYRIETSFNLPNGDEVKSAQVPFPLISVLRNDKSIKNIDYIVRIFTNLYFNDKTYSNIDIYAISTDFFNTLNPYQQKNLYLAQNEILITPEFNRQYLHLDNPQGHVITLGDKGQFLIKDVVEFNPSSRFKTTAIIAFAPEILDGYHDKRHDWYDTHAYAFITMKSGMSPTPEQLNSHVIQHAPQLPGAPFSPEEFIQLSARNIADIHYDNALPDEISTVVSSSYLNILYTSGVFIFFATTMNFFNINNVINTKKRNSFYIKKAVGASNFQLITEAFFIATFQTAFVLLVALFILMSLAQFSDSARELIFTHGSDDFSTALSITTALTYAAILLAHYLFLLTLTLPNNTYSNSIAAQSSQSHYMTRIMFCMQIIIAGVIIYLWAGIMTQMHFMKNYNFGYEKENVITFILSDELKSKTAINNLQDELRSAAGVNSISLSNWRPFDMSRHNISVFHNNQQEKDKLLTVNILKVNKNFINTWGINILAGDKNPLLPSDNSNIYHAIATKSFMTLMGQQSYEHILNTIFYINENNSQQSVRVLNVIDDFYLADREETPPPLLILIQNNPQRYGAVKLESIQDFGKVEKILKRHHVNTEHIKSVNKLHKEYFSNNILMYNTINTVTLFTVILVLISTIIISTSETKRLEKTLAIMESIGGSIYTHIIFFIQQNIIPIVIAVIISLPVSFLLLHNWLTQYSIVKGLAYIYATSSFVIFILCIILVMTITLILNSHTLNSQKKK